MQKNNFTVHAIGNSHILTYHNGIDIFEYFGSPYSSPSLGSIKVNDTKGNVPLNTRIERISKTDIYKYYVDDSVITDFCFNDIPVFVRSVKGDGLVHILEFNHYVSLKDVSFKFDYKDTKVFQAEIRSGTYVYFDYPSPVPVTYNIILSGSYVSGSKIQGNKIVFTGEGNIAVIGGKDYPLTTQYTFKYLNSDTDSEMQNSINRWISFFDRTVDFDKSLPVNIPLRETLLKAIEGTKIALKTQQDAGGGVIAGYPYHLGYVRDQFGVVKGMIKLGMIEEAFNILRYFLNVFLHEGRINNAHGLGFNGVKHVHENDDTEITGYIILLFFDCYDVLNSVEEKRNLFNECLPMLMWALEAQISQIFNGMMPFNGDETYIAGGVLPRNTIYHGSNESTLLFIESASRLVNGLQSYNKNVDTEKYIKYIEECKSKFNENFIKDGRYITNNPERTKVPGFRHGVCEGYCGYFGYLEKGKSDLFLCVDCLEKEHSGKKEFINSQKIYMLKSVLMMPCFIGSNFITIKDIQNEIKEIYKEYLNTKKLPSVQGTKRSLGYDYGFLLNCINNIKDDEQIKNNAYVLYNDTLALTDSTYTWCEYYDDGNSAGTQYRPWESAINIKALIEYAETF